VNWSTLAQQHRRELREGRRFAFGRNWRRFLRIVDEDRIRAAEESLLEMLGVDDLRGRTFLDAGSGSGLFSLAAVRAGARVTAFDYDPDSVVATRALLERWAPAGAEWQVLNGSVLDRDFVRALGPHDIVYSWGVLHHTGAMWQACDIVTEVVSDDGTLFIALYNDAGAKSTAWTRRKLRYVGLPMGLRTLYAWGLILAGEGRMLGRDLRAGRPDRWLRRWTHDQPARGMSRYRDWIDWIGGFPYEYASVPETLTRLSAAGFTARRVIDNGGTGCNEFVMVRADA
jgi:2-polyprenyl-3-methyl-5-hydroxy-6-metoxy-1,4-benzoquinol methylase